MGYPEKAAKVFSSSVFLLARAAPEREPAVLAYGSAGVGHGRKLSQFLLFCKILLALIALSVDKV